MQKNEIRKLHGWVSTTMLLLAMLSFLLANASVPARAAARATEVPPTPALSVRVTATREGVDLEWGSTGSADAIAATAAATAALHSLPTQHFQGYDLPMQLVTLHLPDQAHTTPLQIVQMDSVDWKEHLQPSGPLQPPALDWQDKTDLKRQEQVALPTAPLFILREGWVQGQHIAVVAISPLYQKNGLTKFATGLKVKVAGAVALNSSLTSYLKTLPAQSAQAAGATGSAISSLAPPNAVAAVAAIKVIVSKQGLQSLNGQTFAAAGLNLGTVDLPKLHLYHNGTEIPLEIVQSPDVEVHFYAPSVGDRWNLSEVYWLTVEANNGLRMATRSVAPGDATATQTAVEKGIWEQNLVYESNQPGPDNDHWFNTQMEVAPSQQGNVSSYPTATVSLNPVLPPAPGSATFTVTLSTYFKANYTLHFDLGGVAQDLTWDNAPKGVLIQDWALPLSTSANLSTLHLTLLPGTQVEGLYLDHVFWQRPATLNFQNKGAAFSGVNGVRLYSWQNAPVNNTRYQFYDVTNPLAPVILTGATNAGFQDGPNGNDYLLVSAGMVQTPQAIAHSPVVFSASSGADAIYIAPKAFLAALEPLLAYRRSQGYTVTAVDVQDIYDAWSYGQVSAPAIRSFLRFAKANWHPSPISVVLIGDATWDPHNYTHQNNINFMPAYMANVDPWLGETACENCFVQLDGDDPLTGDGQFFHADMWIGRFPVKSPDELTNVVKKIIHYETDPNMGTWRSVSVFLADNYIVGLDANGKPMYDAAGDFAKEGNDSIKLFPPNTKFKRVYYDPYPRINDPQGVEPWRISDAYTAWSDTMNALNAGAGIVNYNGHSHHWQWASTDPNAAKGYLLSLYDTDLLSNADSLFIDLSMTCYTSQFTKPAISGTTLDERMFLNPRGGAVAVWGPAGLSVALGHTNLEHGFYTALWAAPPMQARLGELLSAGYDDLRQNNTCCQDLLQTFLLMGDPLTPARVQPVNSVYLPLLRHK